MASENWFVALAFSAATLLPARSDAQCSHACARSHQDAHGCCPATAGSAPHAGGGASHHSPPSHGAGSGSATPGASGSVYVSSNIDGAQILLDGNPVGTTPGRINNISPGQHAVAVRSGNTTSGAQIITVQADTLVPVNATLTPAATPAVVPAPTVAANGGGSGGPPSLVACNQGNAAACMEAGLAYGGGNGVTQDFARAAQLYTQACSGGHAPACTALGLLYSEGRGVTQDHARAVQLYTQACNGGDGLGCTALGNAYQFGSGVTVDLARAAQLYTQSCNLGYSGGCNNIGGMYQFGTGVPQDRARAAQFFTLACNGGNQVACFSLQRLQSAPAR